MRIESTLAGRNLKIVGHQNRIFGIKCHPEQPNLFTSAGWDGSVKLYDIRSNSLVCSMGGPQISGDSIDIHGDIIVTGSNRGSDVMQLFSISQQRRIFTFDYSPKSITKINEGYSLATKFSHDGNFIITGGAGLREIKMFVNDSDSTAQFSTAVESFRLSSPVYSLACNSTKDQFAVGMENGNVHLVSYEVDDDFEGYGGHFAHVAAEYVKSKTRNQAMSPVKMFEYSI